MPIRKESFSNKIFRAIKLVVKETQEICYEFGPSFNALLSRKSLDEVLFAMPGYKNDRNFKQKFNTSLARLTSNNFIKFYDHDHFTITNKGRGVLVKFDVDDIRLPDFDPNKWDDIWRVLIFDIPELTRSIRNLFRNKLQELGFCTLQKSVYVTPVACEKEINELAELLRILNGVNILHASKLGRKELFVRKFFGIN